MNCYISFPIFLIDIVRLAFIAIKLHALNVHLKFSIIFLSPTTFNEMYLHGRSPVSARGITVSVSFSAFCEKCDAIFPRKDAVYRTRNVIPISVSGFARSLMGKPQDYIFSSHSLPGIKANTTEQYVAKSELFRQVKNVLALKRYGYTHSQENASLKFVLARKHELRFHSRNNFSLV